ncbi:hypothetical protein Tco_0630449 [Tanacetum coccineum]
METASRFARDAVTTTPMTGQNFSDGVKHLGKKTHLLEDKQFPSVGVFDEVEGMEEIHVTWAHLEKKLTRLRTYTNISQEFLLKRWRRLHRLHVTPSQPISRRHHKISRRRQNDSELHLCLPATPSSGLVPNSPPSAPFVPPSRHEWDLVLKLMFDEFFSPPTSVASPVPVKEAPTLVESTASPSLTPVDQDAPSPKTVSEESSSSDVIPTTMHSNAPISEHLNKWTKDHPLQNILGDPSRPVSTRLQLHEQALFCYYNAFLTSIEPKTYKDALTQSCYIKAMQEELHEFERLKVWELVPRPDKVMSPFQNNYQPKFLSSSQHKPELRPTKDIEAKYNKVKAKLAFLSSNASAFKSSMVKNKGLITEAYEWDKEEMSSNDNEMVEVKVLMVLANDNVAVTKEGARNGKWVKISMRKVNTLLEMEDNDERKNFPNYLCIDLNYVKEQRNNLLSKHRDLVQELNTCKEQLLVLKQAKLDFLTIHQVNTEILKENQNLIKELKELTAIIETWLNSSNKVNQCISEQFPTQKKRILGVDQLIKDPSSSGQKDLAFEKSSSDDTKVSIPVVERPWLYEAK